MDIYLEMHTHMLKKSRARKKWSGSKIDTTNRITIKMLTKYIINPLVDVPSICVGSSHINSGIAENRPYYTHRESEEERGRERGRGGAERGDDDRI